MSEIHAPRGRGSARGGRGGHNFRGGRGGRTTKPNPENATAPSYQDDDEFGDYKKKYSSTLPTMKELFPDWTDADLIFALEDANGDLETAIERITEGNVSQWGEVKKKHTDRSSKIKAKEAQPVAAESAPPSSRVSRGRGGFEGRGRGRGDRGRAGRGGRAGAHVNGARTDKPSAPVSAPVEPPTAEPSPADAASSEATQPLADKEVVEPASEGASKSSLIPEGSKKGWASLFAKPAPSPAQKKPPPAAAPEIAAEAPVEEHLPQTDGTAKDQISQPLEPAEPESTLAETKEAPEQQFAAQAPVESQPPPEVSSAKVAENEVVEKPQEQQPRAPVPVPTYSSAGAYKSAAAGGRTPHIQRRVMDQQQAVVMPGNHAVDRAAVQFGSMGLNGSNEDTEFDQQREEAETRPQPPQHSPVAPRASLPPSTRPPVPVESVAPAPRPAPGLPPAPPTTAADASFTDFNRYGEAQKHYDPFSGQQIEQPQPHPQAQEPFSNQGLPSQPAAATTGADYSAFYGADQSRNPYYYGAYGQPQDVAAAQARASSGFGATGAETQPQIPTSQPPARYGHIEAPNSGQNTPNPTLPQTQPAQPSQHMPQGQGAHGAFNYGYPYYSSPHYPNTYMSQINQQHQYGRNRPMYDDARRYEEHYLQHGSQFNYGNQYAPYGKGGMYGQPQHGFYEHSSSPANAGTFGQGVPGRDASYGRTGSAQPTEAQSTGSTAFGGIPDVFGRTQAGFAQNQPVASQQPVSAEEASKGFDAPKAGGPSPSVAQAHRPGSAANNVSAQPAASQTGLPPVPAQQGSQQAFGGYPHLNPQYGGLGGLGTHHQAGATQTHHQGAGYGNYGAGFGGSNYYGNTGRGGGWGGNYGH